MNGIEDEQSDGIVVGNFGGGDGIRGVGHLVGASIGVDDCIGLRGKDGIGDGFEFGNGTFVGVGVFAVAGVRLWDGDGIVE